MPIEENTQDAPADRDPKFMQDSNVILKNSEKSSNKYNMKMMQMPDMSRFKVEKKSAKYEFQDYVLEIIKEFGIIAPYDKIIWKWSKRNIEFLKGKVENLREQAKQKKENLNTYGKLLIWMLKQK